MPRPSVEKGERMYVISSRLGSDKLKVLPLETRFAAHLSARYALSAFPLGSEEKKEDAEDARPKYW